MKKFAYSIAVLFLLTSIGCKKNTERNTGVLKEKSSETPAKLDSTLSEYTDRYVADDGSSALVTFKKGGKENSISIKSNNKTIVAVEKKQTADETIYGNYDFEITAKKDSVIITQGNNVIKLKKARVQ